MTAVGRVRAIGRSAVAAALLAAVFAPAPVVGQAAPYLKGLKPTVVNDTGISGLWNMTGKVSSQEEPRAQIARDEHGRLPKFTKEAWALFDKRLVDAENGKPYATMGARCLPQGIPLMMFAAVEGPVEILETPGRVTILSTEFNETWLIYLNARHRADPDPNWHGDSIGHWEGDTLVIDTIGLTDRTPLDHIGMPHSDQLRVVTRLRRLDKNTLENRATIYDAKTFTEPWTRRNLYTRAGPDERVEEEVCDNQRNGVDAEGHATFFSSGSPPPAAAKAP